MAFSTEARRAAARENGKLGGRPKGTGTDTRVMREKQVARRIGERSAIEAVLFARALMRGLVAGATAELRWNAAKDFMDRFGYPRLAQQQYVGEFPTKLYELTLPATEDAAASGGNGEPPARGNGEPPDGDHDLPAHERPLPH